MDADEIVPLTSEAVRALLQSRQGTEHDDEELGRRQAIRWPFPGAVEIWVPDDAGNEHHVLGTLHDLSEGGMGIRIEVALDSGAEYAVAVHQPEMSLHGRATVRHCTARRSGYHVGMEFVFPPGSA